MTDYTKALNDPSSVYKFPREVLEDDSLDTEQKKRILHQWEYDARELMVASEENMLGGKNLGDLLHNILEALHQVDPKYDASQSAANKQGGGQID